MAVSYVPNYQFEALILWISTVFYKDFPYLCDLSHDWSPRCFLRRNYET